MLAFASGDSMNGTGFGGADQMVDWAKHRG